MNKRLLLALQLIVLRTNRAFDAKVITPTYAKFERWDRSLDIKSEIETAIEGTGWTLLSFDNMIEDEDRGCCNIIELVCLPNDKIKVTYNDLLKYMIEDEFNVQRIIYKPEN